MNILLILHITVNFIIYISPVINYAVIWLWNNPDTCWTIIKTGYKLVKKRKVIGLKLEKGVAKIKNFMQNRRLKK